MAQPVAGQMAGRSMSGEAADRFSTRLMNGEIKLVTLANDYPPYPGEGERTHLVSFVSSLHGDSARIHRLVLEEGDAYGRK